VSREVIFAHQFLQTVVSRRDESVDIFASEIQDKSAAEVREYFSVFKKKWKQLAGVLIYARRSKSN